MRPILISITFDLGSIMMFLAGLFAGFFMLLLFYLYAVLRGMRKRFKVRKADEVDIDEEEIKWLIKDAQKAFKNKENREENGTIKYLLTVTKELSMDIAQKFYPNSPYPYLELTIDETLALNHYITDRIDELLNSRILNLFRSTTLRRIAEINDTKQKIENAKVVKTVKKYNLVSAMKFMGRTLNLLNPFYWIRTLTVNQITQIVLVKMGMSLIAIVGEETYKIYSKKVFNEEKEIHVDIDSIYDDLEKAFKKEEMSNGQKED